MRAKGLTHAFYLLIFLFLGLTLTGFCTTAPASAADLPLASSSNLVGFSFNDRPLLLPIERNFQMAMLAASSDVGRTCGAIEAYGWHVNLTEQPRINQIFSDTVSSLRSLGYTIEAQEPSSLSRDVTLFAADRNDNKHFLLMWSAGEMGLVMTLCESSAPLHNKNGTALRAINSAAFAPDQSILVSPLANPKNNISVNSSDKFTPIGDWIGRYTCHQGDTGGTLHIAHVDGQNFDGTFRFYGTPKNPSVPSGSYDVYGQYDSLSHRILINPGKWIEHPPSYYNTVIVGIFDANKEMFSGVFQGITGCTSFEAKYAGSDYIFPKHSEARKLKKKHVQKTVITQAPLTTSQAPKPQDLSIVPDQAPPPVTPPPVVTP